MVIWGGGGAGSVGAGAEGGQTPGGTAPSVLVGEDLAAASDSPVAAGAAPVPADAPAAATATAVPGGTSSAGNYEAQVMAQDALIAALPVPPGFTELPPDGAGVRSWTVPGTDWEPQRDAYLAALVGQGYSTSLTDTINDGTNVGELYQLTAPTGTTLQLAVGTFDGVVGIEVTRQ